MTVGTQVWADKGDGPELCHLVEDNQDGTWKVLFPNAAIMSLPRREPADRDASGSGGTFWTL